MHDTFLIHVGLQEIIQTYYVEIKSVFDINDVFQKNLTTVSFAPH